MAQQRAEYRSAVRSKNMIKKAFAKLAHTKDISKITVTDIIKEAEISRGTFYAHYPDVYGLLEQIENEEIEELRKYIQKFGFQTIIHDSGSFIQGIVGYLSSDLEYYRMLFLSKNSDHFLIRIKNFLKQQILSDKNIIAPIAGTAGAASVYISFFTSALASVFVDWLSGEIDITIDDLVKTVSDIVSNALNQNEPS